MKCKHCSYEHTEDFTFCPLCGTDNSEPSAASGCDSAAACSEASVPPISLNPAADHVLGALNSKLFLTVCILFTVSSGLAVFDGNFNVITILLTIFSWLTFSQAKKGLADSSNIRHISGTVYAFYVIEYVLAGLFAVIGLLFSAIFGVISSNTAMISELMSEIEVEITGYGPIVETLLSASSVLVLTIFVIAAVIIFLINFFGLRSIHRFIQSLYQSIDAGQIFFVKCTSAKNWLMTFGVFSAISALSSVSSNTSLALYSEGAMAAALIVASVLVKKNFSEWE